MKKLLIDAGNSGIKWLLLDNEQLSKMQSCLYENDSAIEQFKTVLKEQLKQSKIDEVIMVSVLGDHYIEVAKNYSLQTNLRFTNIEPRAELAGVTNAYTEYHKLGADRLVAMVAAYHLEPNQASIIVDSGTATTIDAVDAQGQHLGGLILPGLDLCSQSLLEGTEQLASFNENKHKFEPNVFSIDTKQAIASGSLLGLAGAIDNICIKMEEAIQQKAQQHSKDKVIIKKLICGGGAVKLLAHLSTEFTHQEDLVMQGLRIITEQDKKLN